MRYPDFHPPASHTMTVTTEAVTRKKMRILRTSR